jgi:hypothetical protein
MSKICKYIPYTSVGERCDITVYDFYEIYFDPNEQIRPIVRNTRTNRILKYTQNDRGYLSVTLTVDSKKSQLRLNRLVLSSFDDNPPINAHTMSVDHINQKRDDNSISNLRWATCIEQANNRSRHVRKSEMMKILATNKIDGRVIEFESQTHAAEVLGLRKGVVSMYLKHGKCTGDGWIFSKPTLELLSGEVFKQYARNKQVSNFGRVLSRPNEKSEYYLVDRTQAEGDDIFLYDDNRKRESLHRIVIKLFGTDKDREGLENGLVVNHINENKEDNSIHNLEVVSQQQNIYHSLGKIYKVVDNTGVIPTNVCRGLKEVTEITGIASSGLSRFIYGQKRHSRFSISVMGMAKKMRGLDVA